MASSSSSFTQELSERNQNQSQPQPQSQQQQQQVTFKTKTVQFLGRTTPIILQKDNGACPLIAICNVLLLRNNLNLSPDIAEVSQEKLLSLVAEQLIDTNSNVNNKDEGYVQNQQQNIADAIDLLPKLATGIDVNLNFRRIDDFEFTTERAIFDLLDIPLYHGWIVDPQDSATANAIGSKFYNALAVEVAVALETQNREGQSKNTPDEECIDFVAATTATLGVPSPNLTRTRSFDGPPHFVSDNKIPRKGDLEEEAELLRALKLSEVDAALVIDTVVGPINGENTSVTIDENACNKEVTLVSSTDELKYNSVVGNNDLHELEPSLPDNCIGSGRNSTERRSTESTLGEAAKLSLKNDAVIDLDQSTSMGHEKSMGQNDVGEKNCLDKFVQNENSSLLSPRKDSLTSHESHGHVLGEDKVHYQSMLTTTDHAISEKPHEDYATRLSCLSALDTNSDFSSGRIEQTDATEGLASSVDGNEPIYEGEECVLGTDSATVEDREPVYEGEVVLAEQADKSTVPDTGIRAKCDITPQGELIRNFIDNNASQLTVYGLLCLIESLKEGKLCIFFRNNHFATMFKFVGELYLLVTDEGYLNQPDVVWEKLNEVNGDTSFVNGNFSTFESQENNTWNELNAMTRTADYLANMDRADQAGLNMNPDLQLAMALQQQEFEQQSPPRHDSQQFSDDSHQVRRNMERPSPSSPSPSPSPKADGKFKEKCTIM